MITNLKFSLPYFLLFAVRSVDRARIHFPLSTPGDSSVINRKKCWGVRVMPGFLLWHTTPYRLDFCLSETTKTTISILPVVYVGSLPVLQCVCTMFFMLIVPTSGVMSVLQMATGHLEEGGSVFTSLFCAVAWDSPLAISSWPSSVNFAFLLSALSFCLYYGDSACSMSGPRESSWAGAVHYAVPSFSRTLVFSPLRVFSPLTMQP